MTFTPEQIEEEALKLPMGARAILAQNLLLSVGRERLKHEEAFRQQLSPWARGLLGIAKPEQPLSDEDIRCDYEAYLERKYV